MIAGRYWQGGVSERVSEPLARGLGSSLTGNQCRGRQGRADGLELTRCWPKKCSPARKVLPHLAGKTSRIAT